MRQFFSFKGKFTSGKYFPLILILCVNKYHRVIKKRVTNNFSGACIITICVKNFFGRKKRLIFFFFYFHPLVLEILGEISMLGHPSSNYKPTSRAVHAQNLKDR